MKYFTLNVFRGSKKNLATYIGAVLIIALGIFICVSMLETVLNLSVQVNQYYKDKKLGDVFVNVTAMPKSKLEKLKKIEGISEVSGVLSEEVRLLTDETDSIVSVHLIGYEDTPLNKAGFSKNNSFNSQTIYMGKKMSTVRDFKEGQKLSLIINDEVYDFNYSGSIYIPNYIYSMPPSGALSSDGKDYDLALIENSRLENLLGKKGIVNELSFKLNNPNDYEYIKEILKAELSDYGIISIVKRDDQISYNTVKLKIDSLVYAGTVIPVIFMAMSVFMLYIVLKKNIDNDRVLIGTMKAMGMKNIELITVYIIQAIIIGFMGNVLGMALAGGAGKSFFDRFIEVFTLPNTTYLKFWNLRLFVFFISMIVCLFAVLVGVSNIIHIEAAQAMRAAEPEVKNGGDFLKNVKLDTFTKMGIKSVLRSPLRSIVISLAIAFPFGMTVAMISFEPTINKFIDTYLKSQTYDLKLKLKGYTTEKKALASVIALKGVESAEAIAEIPVQLKKDNIEENTMMYGLQENSDKYIIFTQDEKVYKPPLNSVIINSRIARKLHLKEGDELNIKILGTNIFERKMIISRIIDESSGGGVYINIKNIEKVFGIKEPVNSILLNAKRGMDKQIKEQAYKTSRVIVITDTKGIVKLYKDNFDISKILINVFLYMSVLTGVILIYNIMLISIRERSNEFATLKILGVRTGEIRKMLIAEEIVYMVIGIFIGVPIAYLIKFIIENMFDPKLYTIIVNLIRESYLTSFAMVLIIILFSTISIMRFIRKIRAVDSLKERS